jgi:hypothetical protein
MAPPPGKGVVTHCLGIFSTFSDPQRGHLVLPRDRKMYAERMKKATQKMNTNHKVHSSIALNLLIMNDAHVQ